MGRKGSGVDVRASSIRLDFESDGVRRRPRLATNGKPMQPTPANIRYAERLAAEIKDRIRLGSFSYAEYFPADEGASTGQVLTLGRQLDTWLASQRIESSTKASYSSAIKFWKAAASQGQPLPLGCCPLRAIKRSDLLLGLASKPKLSGKTVNNYVSVARQACELAVADGTLQANPAAMIPRAAYQKNPPDPFSIEEAEAIIADMLKHHAGPIHNLVEWRFFSGVRTSEMAGLRWPSVDLKARYQRIQQAIVRGVEKNKTKTAVLRDVLLNSRSLAALQRQAAHTRITGQHVWLDPRYGTPWLEERAFRRSYWEPCLKRLGVRYRAPNNMRHTFATMMLMAGNTPAWCATQMGHSVEMFLNTYARWIKGKQDDRELAGLEAWLKHSTKAGDGIMKEPAVNVFDGDAPARR